MKKILLVLAGLIICVNVNAQLGGMLNKAKNKMKSDKKETTEKPKEEVKPESNEAPIEKKKEEKTVAPDEPNDGITSPMHEKYMGKIVFGSTMESIEFKKEVEEKFITKAIFGDEIRYRVYMDNSLVNYLKTMKFASTHGRYQIKFVLDGTIADSSAFSEDAFSYTEKKSMTTFKGALKSAAGKIAVGESAFQRFALKHEDKFTVGDHVLKVEYRPYQNYPSLYVGPVIASGEITLTVKKTIVDPNDPKTCLPKVEMKNPELEKSILKAFNAQKWEETPKEVRIISNKWNIVRNKYSGIITSRYVEAAIGSTKDGKCAYQIFNFYQDYDGKDYQKEVYLSGIGDKTTVSCGCMKK
ncbi:MAG: hypothetical protein AB7O73_09535 [Bacteroidia bacterium]